MNIFKISDIDWKQLPLHPDKFDGYQVSIKCTATFDTKPNNEEYDDTFSFTLIGLDDEEYAVLEVEFYDYSYPTKKKSRVVTQRFNCEMEEFNLIESWVMK